jgi:hypothetical protein
VPTPPSSSSSSGHASFLVHGVLSATAVLAALLLNLFFARHDTITDEFAATTVSYIPKSSPLLYLHVLLTVALCRHRASTEEVSNRLISAIVYCFFLKFD